MAQWHNLIPWLIGLLMTLVGSTAHLTHTPSPEATSTPRSPTLPNLVQTTTPETHHENHETALSEQVYRNDQYGFQFRLDGLKWKTCSDLRSDESVTTLFRIVPRNESCYGDAARLRPTSMMMISAEPEIHSSYPDPDELFVALREAMSSGVFQISRLVSHPQYGRLRYAQVGLFGVRDAHRGIFSGQPAVYFDKSDPFDGSTMKAIYLFRANILLSIEYSFALDMNAEGQEMINSITFMR